MRSFFSSLGGTGSRVDFSSTISAPAMPNTAPEAPAPTENAPELWKCNQFHSVESRFPAAPVRT